MSAESERVGEDCQDFVKMQRRDKEILDLAFKKEKRAINVD